MQEIQRNLFPKPVSRLRPCRGAALLPNRTLVQISSYDITTSEIQFAGLCVGDARSELVLEALKADNFVPILLRGMPVDDGREDRGHQPMPEDIAAISPLAQVRMGKYKTPTCIVHGDKDEVVPCSMSQEFVKALGAAGVPSEVIVSPGAKHMHDLLLKPGKPGWEESVVPAYRFLLRNLFA